MKMNATLQRLQGSAQKLNTVDIWVKGKIESANS